MWMWDVVFKQWGLFTLGSRFQVFEGVPHSKLAAACHMPFVHLQRRGQWRGRSSLWSQTCSLLVWRHPLGMPLFRVALMQLVCVGKDYNEWVSQTKTNRVGLKVSSGVWWAWFRYLYRVWLRFLLSPEWSLLNYLHLFSVHLTYHREGLGRVALKA